MSVEGKKNGHRTGRDSVRRNRPYVHMLFVCCNVYSRLYINKKGTAYEGYCPRCLKRAYLKISRRGSLSKFFIAD